MSAREQLDHIDRYFDKNWMDDDFPTDEIYAELGILAEYKQRAEAAEAKLRELEMQNQKLPDSALCAAGVEPCVCAVANNLDAARYRALRNQDIESNFPRSGLFIGKVPENHCLTGVDADNAVDSLFPSPKQEEK